MMKSDRSAYYQALKSAGVPLEKNYRDYTTEELREAYELLKQGEQEQAPQPKIEEYEVPTQAEQEEAAPAGFFGFDEEVPDEDPVDVPKPASARPPARGPDPNEMAGQRQNSQDPDTPIRVDELGREWYQEEILKPAYPKPRGRRVLTYMETGTKQQQIRKGDFIETFEVAGDDSPRVAEVKITLPSYQVGVFKDPRFPFKVHTYNGNEGFDLDDVQNFYGGAELVPASVKRKYVENVLCYDIRSTVRAIEDEYRRLQLLGKVD